MRVYIGMDNFWPQRLGFTELKNGIDYTIDKDNIHIKECVKPGKYSLTDPTITVDVCEHIKLLGNMSSHEITIKYPKLKKWVSNNWPIQVGRYEPEPFLVVDIVFGAIASKCSPSNRMTRIPADWTDTETKEWLRGKDGYWTGWTYDLEHSSVKDVVMSLLEEMKIDRTVNNVVRHFIVKSNHQDDNGILYGKWGGKMSPSTHPSRWRNTSHVFNARVKTGKPVKYGQCWVYAEILTSVFRYLGIPARTIYSRNARIDRGEDGGIDIEVTPSKGCGLPIENDEFVPDILNLSKNLGNFKVTEKKKVPFIEYESIGEIISKGDGCEDIDLRKMVEKGDSMWNFHVWNEVFLEEDDGKCGWSCLDGCPVRETKIKDHYHKLQGSGPVSITDLKNGKTVNPDFKYFNSTVNAAMRYWRTESVILEDGDTILCTYPYTINYGSTIDTPHSKPVTVHTRNPFSEKTNISLSSKYKPTRANAISHYHQNHPVRIVWKTPPNDREGGELRMMVTKLIDTPHLIQICYMEKKVEVGTFSTTTTTSLILCDRQKCSDLRKYSPPPTPAMATSVSFLMANLKTGEWWTSVI